MNFEFSTATEILFGWGRIAELGKRARVSGTRALFVTGAHPERLASVVAQLDTHAVTFDRFEVSGEPTVDHVIEGVDLARRANCELVVAVGGGSVLDAGKAIAALVANPGAVSDYLEVVGLGKPLLWPSLPLIAVPTTAGTGSEVTRNSVLKVAQHSVKVSLRGLTLLPRIALVDPELTVTVPRDVTAATGLDALTQVIEPYLSKARGPLTDALCLEGMRRAARSLRAAVEDGNNRGAREDLAIASLFGGLALANAKLGAVHGFAAPLGGRFEAPHGALCARLLPAVMHANLEAARSSRSADLLDRFETIAKVLTSNPAAVADAGVEWLSELVAGLGVPRLGKLGVRSDDIPVIVEQAQRASSMKGNPFELSYDTLARILERSL